MDNDEILVRLKQAQKSRRLGHDAYAKEDLQEAGRHFLAAYETDIESQRLLGDTPLVLHALATDLMGLGRSLRGTSGEEICCREIHALNQRRQEILGDTPEVLKALASNLLYLGDLVKDGGDLVEAERCYRERQALNLRRQKTLGDTHDEVLGDLAIDLERLGDLAWDQGELAEAKRYYFVNTRHLISMPRHDLQWPAKCMRTGHRLALLAANQPIHLPEVLLRLALLSEALVEYLDLQSAEVPEHAQAPFAKFHANFLELTVQQAPEHTPVTLLALQRRELAALVVDELENRLQNHHEGTPRRRFLAVHTELRRLASGLQLIPGDGDNGLPRSTSGHLPE